jgi:carbon-monoxide dehydrogenase medium subunit
MALPRFQYHEPKSLAEACRMLQVFGDTAALLAGGTDLLVKMKRREIQPKNVVSLVDLDDLKQINGTGNYRSVGACCTVARIAESEEIRTIFPALASGAGQLGSPQVRNIATVGGNVVTASPAADLPPALMAYGTRVRLVTGHRERFLPLEKLVRGPGATDIREGEILAALHLDKPPEYSGAGFFKLGDRKALQISIVNGACFLSLNPKSGEIEKARIVLGAVAPAFVRAHSAENMLKGEKPNAPLFEEAGRAAARDCSPIDDLRASATYRRDMVGVLTSRTLHAAWANIRQSSARP